MFFAYSGRVVHLGVSVLGLAIGLWGLGRLPALSELPQSAASSVSYPARLGGVEVGSPGEARFLAEARPPGTVVSITSERGRLDARLRPQISRLHFFLIALEGLVLFAVNLVVFWPRLHSGPVRDLYWGTLIYAILTMINGLYFPRSPAWTERVLPLVTIAGLMILPLVLLRLALTFPRRAPILDRHPRMLRWPAAVAGILLAWQAAAYLAYFATPSPAAWARIQAPQLLGRAFLVTVVAASCFLLYRRARRLEMSRERSQARWIVWGITIGVTPYVFLRTIPRLFGGIPAFPPEVDRIFELAIPLAFAVAVVRHQFLDIDIIIRRSLIYGLLAGMLTVVYLLLSGIVAERLIRGAPQYAAAFHLMAAAVPVALFTPTRRWIGTWVDRTFFKIQYDYARSLSAYHEEARAASSREEIADRLETFLREQLSPRGARVVLFPAGPGPGADALAGEDPDAVRACADLGRAGRRIVAIPGATSRPEIEVLSRAEGAGGDAEAAAGGVRVAVALGPVEAPIGVLLLGDKQSERRFVDEDLKLLGGASEIAGDALERLALVTRAAEEALERRKMEEMDRFRRDLFSRVAHDLRTPSASIQWTAQNLLDGAAGEPNPKHAASLQSIQAAAEQLERLANNLLDAERLDRGSPAPGLRPVALASLVEETAAVLRPTAAARGVRLAVAAPPGLPPVAGDADCLRAVLANLVENAVRYSPEGSEVELTVERAGGGRQSVSVRDHGPGLADEDRDRIFERFSRGRPSPYSGQRGFGLGLYVAKTHVEAMGGTLSAGNHPEGGARFTCHLNECPGPGGA